MLKSGSESGDGKAAVCQRSENAQKDAENIFVQKYKNKDRKCGINKIYMLVKEKYDNCAMQTKRGRE